MKEKPILFNTEMVKAILDGRKTQSRRPIRNKDLLEWESVGFTDDYIKDPSNNWIADCPFGEIGDQLYVRETWQDVIAFYGESLDTLYASDYLEDEYEKLKPWKPSIHMPKKYARIWLEITDIRVERVRDITEDESLKEGIISNQDYEDNAGSEDLFDCPMCKGMQVHGCLGENMGVSETDCIICDSQKNRFGLLWDSIYNNWSDNPWVWVIEFKRIEK